MSRFPAQPIRLTIAQRLCRTLPPVLAQRVRTVIYPARTARRDDYEFVVRAQTGSLLKSRTSDFHGYPFSVHGYYEWRNWAVALACCVRGDRIIEIGANIGTETVGFADIVGREGTVYAFEPLPSNVDSLRSALTLNEGLDNVRVYAVAVSDQTTKVEFAIPPAHSSGTGHILRSPVRDNIQVVEVDSVTRDSFQEQIGAPKLIVIDAEGDEIRILRGGRDYIKRFQPIIVLEASPSLLKRAGFQLTDLHVELTSQGYIAYRISRLGLREPDLTRHLHTSNWVCIPGPVAQRTARMISGYLRRCGLRPCLAGVNPLTAK